jgi:hypothetical protein
MKREVRSPPSVIVESLIGLFRKVEPLQENGDRESRMIGNKPWAQGKKLIYSEECLRIGQEIWHFGSGGIAVRESRSKLRVETSKR